MAEGTEEGTAAAMDMAAATVMVGGTASAGTAAGIITSADIAAASHAMRSDARILAVLASRPGTQISARCATPGSHPAAMR